MWLWHGHVVLKSPIFVVQKATAPKNGVEFCQGSIGTIRISLATSYDVWRRRAASPTFDQSEAEKLSHTNSQTHKLRNNILSGPALRAAPAKIKLWLICLMYACDLSEICRRYAWDMSWIYHKYGLRSAWDMPNICMKCAWDLPEICLIYEICKSYDWNVPEICT